MTRSQIAFVAFTVAIVCAATWLALSSEPGTAPDVIDAAMSRPTPIARTLPEAGAAMPVSTGAQ